MKLHPCVQTIIDEYPTCKTVRELSRKIGVPIRTIYDYAERFDLSREGDGRVKHGRFKVDTTPVADTSGIVQAALQARTDLEEAWSWKLCQVG